MLTSTGYAGEVIVDPKNDIAVALKHRDALNVTISSKSGYEHGMVQPAVLVVTNDGAVLYSWAAVPGVRNLGGAKDRPNLKQILENAMARMSGQPLLHKKYASQSFTQVMMQKFLGWRNGPSEGPWASLWLPIYVYTYPSKLYVTTSVRIPECVKISNRVHRWSVWRNELVFPRIASPHYMRFLKTLLVGPLTVATPLLSLLSNLCRRANVQENASIFVEAFWLGQNGDSMHS